VCLAADTQVRNQLWAFATDANEEATRASITRFNVHHDQTV
jgi:hypothetical protein